MSEQSAQERRPGIPLGRPLGVPIYLARSFVVIAVLIAMSMARALAPGDSLPTGTDYAVGIVYAAVVGGSVLAHELGHSIVSLVLGIPIRRITLFIFGGYAEISREPRTPAEEYLIAIAGPLVSLLFAGCGQAVALATTDQTLPWQIATGFADVNLMLGLLNLIPGLPLDGGRVLRAGIWHVTGDRVRATRISVRSGQGVAILAGVAGVTSVMSGSAAGAFLLVLAGFLWITATALGRYTVTTSRVPSIRIRELARRAIAVPSGLPLAEALRQGEQSGSWPVTVDSYGRPAGVVSSTAVDAVPPARRPWITAGEVSATIVPEIVLPADLSGEAVVAAMRATPASEYLVVERDGAVVGVLAMRDVAHHLESRHEMAGAPA